jgi:hypothetical protein
MTDSGRQDAGAVLIQSLNACMERFRSANPQAYAAGSIGFACAEVDTAAARRRGMREANRRSAAPVRIRLNAGSASADCNLAIRQALMLITCDNLKPPVTERHDRAPALKAEE